MDNPKEKLLQGCRSEKLSEKASEQAGLHNTDERTNNKEPSDPGCVYAEGNHGNEQQVFVIRTWAGTTG